MKTKRYKHKHILAGIYIYRGRTIKTDVAGRFCVVPHLSDDWIGPPKFYTLSTARLFVDALAGSPSTKENI